MNKFDKNYKKESAKNKTEQAVDRIDEYSIKGSLDRKSTVYKKALVALVVVALLMFGAGMKYARYLEGKPLTDVAEAGNIVQTESFETAAAGTDCVVKIEGCADKTGYFSVSNGTSLRELLEYAGVASDGDISDFDFSHKLQQGDIYYIKSKNNPVDAACWLTCADAATGGKTAEEKGEDTSVGEAETGGGQININTADLEELKTLDGIGDTKAQAIIDYREKHGDFTRIEDIVAVKGIGAKTYEKLKAEITV
ncbi:MAG: ComEA family DNA-binding protein [Bacillota bacterium]